MQVLLAKPRGFCAGVDRAIEIVERALQIHGAPIYVRHEVVHNKFVTDDLPAEIGMTIPSGAFFQCHHSCARNMADHIQISSLVNIQSASTFLSGFLFAFRRLFGLGSGVFKIRYDVL